MLISQVIKKTLSMAERSHQQFAYVSPYLLAFSPYFVKANPITR
jgi:hypothetical protein